MRRWPALEFDEMRCPTLLVAGSKNENVMRWINANPQAVDSVNLQIEIIQGLTHPQEFSQVEKVLPVVYAFFKQIVA